MVLASVLKLIETTFQKPLEELSKKRKDTLKKAVHLPIKTVLEAFHADASGLLRLYAEEHVDLTPSLMIKDAVDS